MEDIHINWQGPYSLEKATQLTSDIDYGLYQYYGGHSVYGENTLLYLGSATKQTLGQRLLQHNWHLWSTTPVEIYAGRLCVENKIDLAEARNKLLFAEKILLFSHSPAFNTVNLNSINHNHNDVRIMNWGHRNKLLPEVSISRWEGGLTTGHSVPRKFLSVSFAYN